MVLGETKLGYTITELVGQGGFGTVYKAVKKNKALETVRALKHISLPSRKEWTDVYNSMGNDMARTDAYFDTILQEILNEIRILADLTNKGVKNVVWYYENEIEDTPSPKHYDIYLLMEFLNPLTSYMETNQIKVRDVIKIGKDILSALIECHKRKIIHRDIKTDNIFISEDGDYKLGDFGVSKKLSDRSRATSMKGTPNFIAPEVYLGLEYNETVDLYSLGIVLYRLLNYNRNPFMPDYPTSYNSEDEDKAFELRMKGEIPDYPEFAKNALGDIILKSISNSESRYKSATEFKDALDEVSKAMSNEELDVVVLENQLNGVDFSTFGSKDDFTQMAYNNQSNMSNVQNNSFQNSQSNSFSMNASNSYTNTNFNQNNNMPKKKSALPIVLLCVLLVILAAGGGAFFMLKNNDEKQQPVVEENIANNGKFVQEDGFTKFIKKNGDYAQNEWVFYENNEYYFNGRQSLVTNDSVDFYGKTYYVDSEGAKIINDWYKAPNGKEYYLDDNGEAFKDTAKTINGAVYFFNDKGEKVKDDWFLYENNYYYVDNNGEMLKNQFKEIEKDWYYLGGDGKMLKETFYDEDGKTYYFDTDGRMKSDSLFLSGSSVYYAQPDGAIKKGGWCYNDLYYADEEGKILVNTTTPDGVKVDATGRRVIVAPPLAPPKQSVSTQPRQTQQSSSSIHTISTDKQTDTGTNIVAGEVDWGEHLRQKDNIPLEDYGGEEGKYAKINIDITKLRDDGSAEVAEVNRVISEIFDAVIDRAETALPFKSLDFNKTSLSICNTNTLIIIFSGSIKGEDGSKENMRYKLTLNRATCSASYEETQ